MRLGRALFLLAAAMPAMQAVAAPIDDWRARAVQIRTQVENDAEGAYRAARQLQADLPAGATMADRVKALNLIGRAELYQAKTALAAEHAAQALALAKAGNDQEGRVEADLTLAMNTVNQGRIDDMVAAVKDGMDALAGTERVDLRAEMMLRASMMYLRLGQLDRAVRLAMEALDIAQNSDNAMAMAYAEQAMATTYYQSGRNAEARIHYQRMLAAAADAHSTVLAADAETGLGAIEAGTGDVADGEHRLESGIALYRQVGGPFYVGHALFQLAAVYRSNGQPQMALPLLDEDLRIYAAHDNIIGLWWTLNARSELLQGMGRKAEARADAERCYALAEKLGVTVYLAGSKKRLAEIAAADGDFKQAYARAAEAAELTARAQRENTGENILRLAQRYQDENRQRRINELLRHNQEQALRQRWLWTLAGGSMLMFLVSVMFTLRLRQSREEIRKLNLGLEQRVQERTAELEQSRRSLAEAQRIAHIGSWELDLATGGIEWSEQIYRIFEMAPQQAKVTYEDFLQAVHPDDRQRVDSAYVSSLENKTPYETEHRLLFPDGRIKYVHERCETYYGVDGKPLRSLGTTQDITERKEAELKLKESLEFTEGVINAIPDVLFKLSREGRYRNVWTHTPQLLAVQKDELLGRTVHDLLSPEAARTVMEALSEAEEHGLSFGKEIRIDLPQGPVWFELSASKLAGGTPADTRFLVLSRDVTERKRAEDHIRSLNAELELRVHERTAQLEALNQELRESEQRFRTLAENAPDIIMRYDRDCRRLYVNPAYERGVGIPSGQALGAIPGAEWKSPSMPVNAFKALLRRVMETGQQAEAVIGWPMPGGGRSGDVCYYAVRIVEERDADGRVSGALAMGRDITDLKRVERRLEDSRRQLREMSALREKARDEERKHIAHEIHDDLGQVLTALKLGIATTRMQYAQDNKALDEKLRDLVGLSDRSIQVVRNVAYRLRPSALDMGVVPALEWLASEFVRHTGVSCNVVPSEERPVLDEASAMVLFRVVQEGLTNISRHAEAKRVEISLSCGAGSCRLGISDDGRGFDPSAVGGKSFGLLGIRERVERLGGEVVIDSAPGRGTRIQARLPCERPAK